VGPGGGTIFRIPGNGIKGIIEALRQQEKPIRSDASGSGVRIHDVRPGKIYRASRGPYRDVRAGRRPPVPALPGCGDRDSKYLDAL
jgi:hypothetical protein